MAATKLSSQDKKDLEKFTKFLSLKAAQIIVQSRLGEKVQTKSKPHSSGTDWFNLAIKDIPEVLSEAKKAMSGEIPSVRVPLCVEISLKTVEGDSMMLETWCMSMLDQCDPSVRVTYTVYNRMGILLKSLISVTRVTPAYKLSRRQGPDSYVICYRIYMGEPQLHHLGEGYNQVRVGQLSTPVGTLHLSVAYRTKMTISPQHTGKDNSIMLKSDHFHPDLSPRHVRHQQSEQGNVSLSETVKVGAFADCVKKPPLEPELVIPNVPFSSLLSPRQECPADEAQAPPKPKAEPTAPEKTENETDTDTHCQSPSGSPRSCGSGTSTADDFIMRTPFAGPNANSDLGAFYRECQSAPPLKTFQEQPTLAEQVGDLTKQLEVFEVNMIEYDELLTSLCQDENKQ